jgi:hypothetical protein
VDTIGDPGNDIRLNRRRGQNSYIELWCEAGGMAPMLAQMVRSRDVSVYSTGGFSSVTVTYEVARRVARRDLPTYFLHVGDYDPSGESIFTSMSQDIGAFVAAEIDGYIYGATGQVEDSEERPFFIPQRVALTEEQVDEFDLPTAPPKASDSRSANWVGETTQAEAMPPDLLERIVLQEIDGLTDQDALRRVRQEEREEKKRINAAVNDMSVESIIEKRGLHDPTLLDLIEEMRDKDLEG